MQETSGKPGLARRGILALATGFGLGYAPVASGTFGTLPGLAVVAGLHGLERVFEWGIAGTLALTVLGVAAAIPVCHIAERHFGKKDDGRIVADEYMTYPICLLGLPWIQTPWLLGLAFVSHRFFDILKPPPAYRIQNIGGGAGIVLDDAVSSLYALAFNHGVWWIATRIADHGGV